MERVDEADEDIHGADEMGGGKHEENKEVEQEE